MTPLTQEELDLLAKAAVYTRRSYFTDAERFDLATLIGRISNKWDDTVGQRLVFPVAFQRAQPASWRAGRRS